MTYKLQEADERRKENLPDWGNIAQIWRNDDIFNRAITGEISHGSWTPYREIVFKWIAEREQIQPMKIQTPTLIW